MAARVMRAIAGAAFYDGGLEAAGAVMESLDLTVKMTGGGEAGGD